MTEATKLAKDEEGGAKYREGETEGAVGEGGCLDKTVVGLCR